MFDTKLVMVTTGTKGDLYPFVALAKALQRRGLRPVIATNSDHVDEVRRHDIEVDIVSPPDLTQSNLDLARFKADVKHPSRKMILAYFEELSARTTDYMIFARTDAFMAILCAEKFGVPYVNVHLQPVSIPNPWEKHLFRMGWRAWEYFECREIAALPPIETMERAYADATLTLSLFPDWFGLPNSKLWTSGHATGFPFLEDPEPRPDPVLEEFIARAGPPIVFAPGTGVSDVGRLFALAREACLRTGRPGLFMTRHVPEGELPGELMLVRAHANFTHFLDRAALIVHHGGVGTIAQAIRAGIPQLVRPMQFDQPDNAARVAALGLGEIIDPFRETSEGIARQLRRCLADDAMLARIREHGRLVRAGDGAERAADAVQRMLAGRRTADLAAVR